MANKKRKYKEFDNIKENRWCGEWVCIDFLSKSKSGKTNIYHVVVEGGLLGIIKWYAHWRRYAFFPEPDTLYEESCLKDIAKFLEGKTKSQRSK